MPLQKWSVTARRVVLADRWIHVRADTVVTGQGATLDPFYILQYPDWVHIVALTADDRVVLIRQYRHGAGVIGLELPCGAVDASDGSVQAAAERELLEETGYRAAKWEPVSWFYANPATQTNRVHTFLALGAERVAEQSLDHGEEIVVDVTPVAEVVAGLRTGLIGNGLHVASILQALMAVGRIGG